MLQGYFSQSPSMMLSRNPRRWFIQGFIIPVELAALIDQAIDQLDKGKGLNVFGGGINWFVNLLREIRVPMVDGQHICQFQGIGIAVDLASVLAEGAGEFKVGRMNPFVNARATVEI